MSQTLPQNLKQTCTHTHTQFNLLKSRNVSKKEVKNCIFVFTYIYFYFIKQSSLRVLWISVVPTLKW